MLPSSRSRQREERVPQRPAPVLTHAKAQPAVSLPAQYRTQTGSAGHVALDAAICRHDRASSGRSLFASGDQDSTSKPLMLGWYGQLLRRGVYYLHVTHSIVWALAGRPKVLSQTLTSLQLKFSELSVYIARRPCPPGGVCFCVGV